MAKMTRNIVNGRSLKCALIRYVSYEEKNCEIAVKEYGVLEK